MDYEIVKYEKKYFKQCLDYFSSIWDFNKFFPGLKKENLINLLFFKLTTLDSNYSELIIDKNKKVLGLLFGRIKKNYFKFPKSNFLTFTTLLSGLCYYLFSYMGQTKSAKKTISQLFSIDKELSVEIKNDDAFVATFIINEDSRGLGLGKLLMDNFIKEANKKGCNRVYLWTDKGCNYGYYDHNGFTRVTEITSELLPECNNGPNGFAYIKELHQKSYCS